MAMAPRGPRPALLLTLGLLATCLALASGQTWVELNKIFRKHHVNYPRTPVPSITSYCNKMMKDRGLYWTPVNTFIHAPSQSINRICSENGTALPGGLRRSKSFITVTTCKYNSKSNSYDITYVSRKIVIGCWKRLAVYFKE